MFRFMYFCMILYASAANKAYLYLYFTYISEACLEVVVSLPVSALYLAVFLALRLRTARDVSTVEYR